MISSAATSSRSQNPLGIGERHRLTLESTVAPPVGSVGADRRKRARSMSQSRSVRSTRCSAPARRTERALDSRRASPADANRSRTDFLLVFTSRASPVSRSTNSITPTSGSSSSRGSTISMTRVSWRRRDRPQAVLPIPDARRSDTTTARPGRRPGAASRRRPASRSVPPAAALGLVEPVHRGHQMPATGGGPMFDHAVTVDHDHAEPVPDPVGE